MLKPTPNLIRRRVPHSALLLVCALAASLGGCRTPLLTADEDRSQFHRYDRVRDQDDPAFLMDEFGRRRPNLRGRLLSRE